jgi:tetratricopeptide (TPR) repeat protein
MKLQNIIVRVILLCLAALIVVGCGGAEQRKAKYLERGKEYFAQESYDKALVELKNVLQIDPKDAEAYYLLGKVEEQKENWQQAFGNYSRAVELNPNHTNALYKLGLVYYLTGDTGKASEKVDEILKIQPNNLYGRTLRAAIMYKKGDKNGAIRETEKILTEDPSLVEAINSLSSIYVKMGDQDKAIEVLDKGIVVNPKNIPLRLQLAGMLSEKKETRRAEEVLQEIISLQPGKLTHRLSLAAFYAQHKLDDKVEKVLRDAVQSDPEDPNRYFILADFLVKHAKADKAEEELRSAIKAHPKNYRIRLGLSRLYESMGETDKSVQTYRETIDAAGVDPTGLTARNRLANLLAQQGKRGEAGTLIEEVLKENPGDNDALLTKGKLALINRDTQGAITAFQSVLKDQPSLVDAYVFLSEAHMLRNEQELAMQNLHTAIKQNPKSVAPHLALARIFAHKSDLGAVAQQIEQALEIAPNDLEVLQAKAEYLRLKNDSKGLQVVLEKIRNGNPDVALGYYQLGQLYLLQKKFDSAIHEFELAMERTQDISQPLSSIVSANLQQGKPEKAIARLNDLLKKAPNQLLTKAPNQSFTYNLLGEVYAHLKKYGEAEQSYRKAIESNPKWNLPYANLAKLFLLKGNIAMVGQVYQQGLNENPDDSQLLLALADYYGATRDYDKAITAYERILRTNADNDVAANNLASLLADNKTDDQSLKRALELAKRFESSPQPTYMDTLGWVYYKSGDIGKAAVLFEKVVKQDPNVPVYQYHLGMAYHKQGKTAEAKKQLVKAVGSKSSFVGVDEARTILSQMP